MRLAPLEDNGSMASTMHTSAISRYLSGRSGNYPRLLFDTPSFRKIIFFSMPAYNPVLLLYNVDRARTEHTPHEVPLAV